MWRLAPPHTGNILFFAAGAAKNEYALAAGAAQKTY
jgi:hypothetical protein